MTRNTKDGKSIIPIKLIEQSIYHIRGEKIILDADLAYLYGVSTSRLNEQVKRNIEKFPEDFAFRLKNHEVTDLKSQIATSSLSRGRHGGRRNTPLAFTEYGAIMAASVLNSPRAVEVSLFVVRAFVKLREFASTHKELALKLDELERKVARHDQAIAGLINTIRNLMSVDTGKKRPIGFTNWKE